ncbi:MAG: hypothetical protein M3Q98_08240 [Actinomycetota bacterium]|nr:hypothetical protein [Actinomycetota bacterium]
MTKRPTRALFVTDSDSYVKWGAALAGAVPEDWAVRLVVTRSNAEPSPRQLAEALDGSRFAPDDVDSVGIQELRDLLREWAPDVLVTAARGHTVQAVITLISNTPDRPVIVSGMAGISIPVLPFGLGFRRAVDVFVVHSHRELREFEATSAKIGIPHTYELATVPFLDTAPFLAASGGRLCTGSASPVRGRIVFAAQAMVPAGRQDRMTLVRRLADAARAHPQLLVVIKVRALSGEPQTHPEQYSYEDLLAKLATSSEGVPANLVIENGSMTSQLERAVGLVTVSSTSVLEAVAREVPCLVLSDFGVGAEQINLVFQHSGLLGTTRDLIDARFHHPDAVWLADNYFHDPSENTWIARIESLLELRGSTGLRSYSEMSRSWLNRLRLLFYRHVAFAPERGTQRDLIERPVLAIAHWINRRRWEALHLVRRLGN